MKTSFAASMLALALLAGCGGKQEFFDPAVERPRVAKQIGYASGESGWNIIGGDNKKADDGGAGIGVNSFLWRASLDTLAFMPLSSADPFGGVIITDWFSPAETLRMATSTNGELLALSGLRSPYAGKLGVVEQGALADLLLVDGDPLADINLVTDPERNFRMIMKDGKIYKNSL